jgi:hypothetical protein
MNLDELMLTLSYVRSFNHRPGRDGNGLSTQELSPADFEKRALGMEKPWGSRDRQGFSERGVVDYGVG